MRIVEIVEKFPKLSGLTELVAHDLCVSCEKGLIAICDKKLESLIRPKDVIYFDLIFSEIWLDIEMSMHSEDCNLKIFFEIKVKVDSYISELKNILIKMGIKSWAKYILDDEETDDFEYYIFSEFSMILGKQEGQIKESSNIELENFHGKK